MGSSDDANEGDAPQETPGVVSVALRLQRTTTEYAYVSIPLDEDLLIPQPDGTSRLHTERLFQRGVAIGDLPGVFWYPEERSVRPHPLQEPPESGEKRYEP